LKRHWIMTKQTAAVLKILSGSGLLLEQDKQHPNVATLVTGESLRTSWWSHPKGRLIFAVLSELADHPDVLFTKLLYRKVTLVHRKLWPAFLAVASANEPWQLRGLPASGRRLLASLNDSKAAVRSSGPAVKELEIRLLAHCEEVHTETGQHEIVMEPWRVWSKRVGSKPLRSIARARQQLEESAVAIGAPLSALPWPSDRSTAAQAVDRLHPKQVAEQLDRSLQTSG
jgi:hypothetical protein